MGAEFIEVTKESQELVEGLICFDPVLVADKTIDFAEMVADIHLYKYQREFAWRVAYSLIINDGEEITSLFARQAGKTEAIAVLIAGCTILFPALAQVFDEMKQFKHGLWVGVFAPIYDQALTTYDRINLRIRTETSLEILRDPDIQTQLIGRGASLDNGSFVRVMSASKQSNIESKTYHLCVLEECQDIDEVKVLRSIHPMLASTNGTIVKIGTPNGRKCEFLSAIQRNRRKDLKVKDNRFKNHFQFDYKTCQEANPRYKKYIDREIERFGLDGDFFRMAYRLHWMLEVGIFISEEKFDSCVQSSVKLVTDDENGVYVFGLDLGKANDSTVLTILELDVENIDEMGFYKKTIANWLEITGEDYESQFWQIWEYLAQYRILRGCIDKTAVGDPMSDRLYAMFEEQEVDIDPVVFSTQSKSRMYKYLLQEINAVRLVIPGHPSAIRTRKYKRFRNQMLDLEKQWRGQYMVISHPKVKNAHDDFSDSLALAVWAGSEVFMREIEPFKLNVFHSRETNPLFSRRADRTIYAKARRNW